VERIEELDRLEEYVWDYWREAADDPDHPARTPTFATPGPAMRTVVVRGVDPDRRTLVFHTDRRSAKVDAIRGGTRAGFHHWTPNRMQQFRFRGDADLHVDDDLADRIWNAEPESSRDHYRKTLAPGTELEHPRSTHPATDEVEPPDDPRSNFAVVRFVADLIDWLHLHPEGHYRAQMERSAEGWSRDWVVP